MSGTLGRVLIIGLATKMCGCLRFPNSELRFFLYKHLSTFYCKKRTALDYLVMQDFNRTTTMEGVHAKRQS